MIKAQDYWHERLGRHMSPEGANWQEALMGSYPHVEPGRPRTRLGGSEPARFLISDAGARVWAPVLPDRILPPNIQFQPTSSRKRRDWIIDVILAPPELPFLAASVGMSGADAAFWRISTSTDLIAFGGAAALFDGQPSVVVDRRAFLDAVAWFRETQVSVSELLTLSETRSRFRGGILTGAQARARIGRLKTTMAELDRYPGGPDPSLMKLAAYAANEWVQEGQI